MHIFTFVQTFFKESVVNNCIICLTIRVPIFVWIPYYWTFSFLFCYYKKLLNEYFVHRSLIASLIILLEAISRSEITESKGRTIFKSHDMYLFQLFFRNVAHLGAPRWLRHLSVWLGLRSWSQGPGIQPCVGPTLGSMLKSACPFPSPSAPPPACAHSNK